MNEIARSDFDALIFDLDGVITQSARVHARAWKEMFDPFLSEKGEIAFDIEKDYSAYIDGKPRLEGIRSFLESRNIRVGDETVQRLGDQKNSFFLRYLEKEGVEVYKTSVAFVIDVKKKGFKVAVVSSSKNCSPILKKAGIEDLFEVQVDGIKSQTMHLKGKPSPDIFLQAAQELKVSPERSVVIEDSLAGVRAGKNGGFALVIGVNRADQEEALKQHGANWVVSDLKEIKVAGK